MMYLAIIIAIYALLIIIIHLIEHIVVKPNSQELPTMINRRVKIDKNFKKHEKQAILRALDRWNDITCGIFNYIIVDDQLDDLYADKNNHNTIVILRGTTDDTLINQIDYIEDCTIYGYAISSTPGVILIIPERLKSIRDFENIVTHEIGHLLCIGHVSDRRSIMSKYYSGQNNLTDNDLLAFMSCCEWDHDRIKYWNNNFWVQEKKGFTTNRLKRFYDYKK